MDAFELYRDEGTNFRSVLARIDSDHFCIETQDMGPTTDEFWTKVPKEAWGDLLMAIAKEFLVGDARATDRLRDICRKHDVKHEWDRWA